MLVVNIMLPPFELLSRSTAMLAGGPGGHPGHPGHPGLGLAGESWVFLEQLK